MQIENKTALVLGAGGGLGSAIAQALAHEGARVVAADVDGGAADICVQKILADRQEAFPLTWDIGNLAVIDDNVKAIEQRFGPVDILVNNTGGPPPTPASGQDPAAWMKHFQSMVCR